ncbi:dihydrodipicolinate synthase family protein, partial [Fervidobacterium gondwanense]
SNVVPKEMVEMVEALFRGELQNALNLHVRLIPLFKVLFIETNPMPVKGALHIMERIQNEFRLPLVPPKESTMEKLRAALRELGVIS